MSRHPQEGLIVYTYTNNPYVGWDPLLGMRVNVVCMESEPIWESTYKHKTIHKQKRVQQYNRAKQMMFTRSIGYS